MLTQGVSIDTMFSHIAANNIPTMMYGTILALLIISGLILFAMRSWKIGLISLLPNLLPALMTFGLWGYLNGLIGLTESIITSVTLGLIVDDTIHFLSKYQRGIKELTLSNRDAILYAYQSVGVSMVITSVVFVVGFGVLALSHYEGTSHLGLLTAITIFFALAADLFFLPALLAVAGKTGRIR
jgi:predicted RND superfamily exporter protein